MAFSEVCPTCGAHVSDQPKRLRRQLERAREWRNTYLDAEQKAIAAGRERFAPRYAQLAKDWATLADELEQILTPGS